MFCLLLLNTWQITRHLIHTCHLPVWTKRLKCSFQKHERIFFQRHQLHLRRYCSPILHSLENQLPHNGCSFYICIHFTFAIRFSNITVECVPHLPIYDFSCSVCVTVKLIAFSLISHLIFPDASSSGAVESTARRLVCPKEYVLCTFQSVPILLGFHASLFGHSPK